MQRIGTGNVLIALAVSSVVAAALARADGAQSADKITLERIMSDPDWIGNAPQRPYWADDGKSIYFTQKRVGEETRDLIQIDPTGKKLRVVADEDKGRIDVPGDQLSKDRRRKVYAHHGDLFLKDLKTGDIRQLTRTTENESNPRFMLGDDRISFRRGSSVFVRELNTGLEFQPADLRAKKDPVDKKDEKSDYLKDQQKRLFEHVRRQKGKKESARQRSRSEQRADATRVQPWYLGDDVRVLRSELSPTGDRLVVTLAKKKSDRGKRDHMPNYVTESGYVSDREVRSKVGTGKPSNQRLFLLDLESHGKHEIDLSVLPGIDDDPFAGLNKSDKEAEPASKPADAKKKDAKPKPRPVNVGRILFNDDGSRLVVQVLSQDNKDRWIAAVDLDEKKLIPLERFTDEAWINRRFTQLGWLKDNETLYFLSERDGYGHLYLRSTTDGSRKQLTKGEYEVSALRLSRDGDAFYFTANREHAGIYETYRLTLSTGRIEQLTDLGGRNTYILSPDESRLLVTHSTAMRPAELVVQRAQPGATPFQLTNTVSEEFTALPWVKPKIVEVPSRSGRSIYARVYTPPNDVASASIRDKSKRPAVIFIHGAGYLQNAHHGWSHYFREFMFHSLLAYHGYVVIDPDYRASAGYGRDWRTAIYRQMGTPELEDVEDCIAWLVKNQNVDKDRIGIYGGSYGGFVTLMALFKKPGLLACGAALRPVTDWAHYNHGYTANILNTPGADPKAFEKSSPIEFADGLADALLICHGMQDDNVFFQDTVRLAQRLIELEKENWEVAMFPIEPHGFKEPASWLNEYRRIFRLFETHLKTKQAQ